MSTCLGSIDPYLYKTDYVHEICINIDGDPTDKHHFLYEKKRLRQDTYLLANVLIDGNRLDSVGFISKGNSSFRWAKNLKKPFKLDLNEFVRGKNYQGFKKIKLHNGAGDPTFIREPLAYHLLREMDIPAPETAYTKLYINDEYWGVYIMVEHINKDFLKKHFSTSKGALIKNRRPYKLGYDLREKHWLSANFDVKSSNNDDQLNKFYDLIDLVLNPDQAHFESKIGAIFDVPLFLKILATRLAIRDTDGFYSKGHNYYLFYNEEKDLIQMIPWDINYSFGVSLKNYRQPININCLVRAYFSIDLDEKGAFLFSDRSKYMPKNRKWNFGDGHTSTQLNPSHKYHDEGSYKVCLTVDSDYYNVDCNHTRCQTVFTPNRKTKWKTDIPKGKSHELLQKVFAMCSDCANKKWDWRCELRYLDVSIGRDGYWRGAGDKDFSILPRGASNPLVSRLLMIPKYKKSYLNTLDMLLSHHFNTVQMTKYAEKNHALIVDHVMSDPLYKYPYSMCTENLGVNNIDKPSKHAYYLVDKLLPFIYKQNLELTAQLKREK